MTFRYTHLLAMVALVMSVASGPAFAQTNVDYDNDNDGYIEISTRAQLNAVRWDLNADGAIDASASTSDTTAYNNAFSNAVSGMGCPASGCTGYELTANINAGNWTPIGGSSSRYTGDFNGNGNAVQNLRIRSGASWQALFGVTHSTSRIEAVGLTNVDLESSGGGGGWGALIGENNGQVVACYATGQVIDAGFTSGSYGGLVGENRGSIHSSWASVRVIWYRRGGGLVGRNYGTITNSFATGQVDRQSGSWGNGGGLVGEGGSGITNSYWNTTQGYFINGCGSCGTGRSPAQLQAPVGYTGIYANWNADVTGDRLPDNPWNFGTSSQYPTLKTPAQRAQQAVIDYDMDNDGLIDVTSLYQLNAIRHDLNGDGAPTDTLAYAGAFPDGQLGGGASTLMGCTSGCTGYELTADLNFDTTGNDTVNAADAYPNWTPIGAYDADFNGNGHTITHLTINSNMIHTGLFANLASGGTIEDVGIINASVRTTAAANHSIAVLLGINNGTVTTSYVQGGSVTLTSGNGHLGGLTGTNNGVIRAAYATASVNGGSLPNSYIGGLIGTNNGGRVTATYAAGAVSGTGASTTIGGFVGRVSNANSMICESRVESE